MKTTHSLRDTNPGKETHYSELILSLTTHNKTYCCVLKFWHTADRCHTQCCNTYENTMLSKMLRHLTIEEHNDQYNNKRYEIK
jgi:hypothetical protein